MKVAGSIPDPIFAEADRLIRQPKLSRNDVYARVTVAMNEAVEIVASAPDAFSAAAARQVFDRVE